MIDLFQYQDLKYKEFHQKLMPTVDKDTVIGVRTPILRRLSKDFSDPSFLKELPHRYYEENNLHAFLIEQIKDFDACIDELERFLPYIDNWATCDMLTPRCFKRNTELLLPYIQKWIKSEHTYTVRFAVNMLMKFYLGDNFSIEYSDMVKNISSKEYYVNMVRAWYFATALAKHYDEIIPYLLKNKLDKWTHNKTIRKAIESYRITKEQKDFLKKLKRL